MPQQGPTEPRETTTIDDIDDRMKEEDTSTSVAQEAVEAYDEDNAQAAHDTRTEYRSKK